MAFKHSLGLLAAWSTLAIAGGCSDNKVDPSLAALAGAPSDVGEGGGTPQAAGEAGSGGEPVTPQGGQAPAQGGQAPVDGEGGAESAPLGELVPCDSADCCKAEGGKAVGVELLEDGGFETGTPADGSPWSEVSTTSGNELIINNLSLGFKPEAGDYFAYLSGIVSEESTIHQEVVVPKDAGWMVVSGSRLFQVDSQDDVNLDFCDIDFHSYPDGSRELALHWGSPTDSTGDWGDTRTWKFFEASWDATPHQGLKGEIDFRASSDDYSADPDLTSSSYLFDELSLKAFRCYK